VLSHKTYQNQGIYYVTIAYCYVTKTFVARNKFPHVKVARDTKKVGQAWCTEKIFKWRAAVLQRAAANELNAPIILVSVQNRNVDMKNSNRNKKKPSAIYGCQRAAVNLFQVDFDKLWNHCW